MCLIKRLWDCCVCVIFIVLCLHLVIGVLMIFGNFSVVFSWTQMTVRPVHSSSNTTSSRWTISSRSSAANCRRSFNENTGTTRCLVKPVPQGVTGHQSGKRRRRRQGSRLIATAAAKGKETKRQKKKRSEVVCAKNNCAAIQVRCNICGMDIFFIPCLMFKKLMLFSGMVRTLKALYCLLSVFFCADLAWCWRKTKAKASRRWEDFAVITRQRPQQRPVAHLPHSIPACILAAGSKFRRSRCRITGDRTKYFNPNSWEFTRKVFHSHSFLYIAMNS